MKSYTDIEQSRKLARILPPVSADMVYTPYGFITPIPISDEVNKKDTAPCWSLMALLEVLNSKIYSDDGDEYTLYIYKESDKYSLSYINEYDSSKDIEPGMYDVFVDCCYDMIIRLHELNLI